MSEGCILGKNEGKNDIGRSGCVIVGMGRVVMSKG